MDDDCANPEPLLLPLRRARVGRPSGAMTNTYRTVYWLSRDKQASVRLIAEAQKDLPST